MPKHVQTGTVHMRIYGEGEVATVGRERRPSAHPHYEDRYMRSKRCTTSSIWSSGVLAPAVTPTEE